MPRPAPDDAPRSAAPDTTMHLIQAEAHARQAARLVELLPAADELVQAEHPATHCQLFSRAGIVCRTPTLKNWPRRLVAADAVVELARNGAAPPNGTALEVTRDAAAPPTRAA